RTQAAANIIANTLKTDFSQTFRDKENFGYQDFYGWSMQISGNDGNFLSSIYGIYKSKHALGTTPEWTYEFTNRPITQPWVFEHSDTSQFILIQEQDHTIHGIHPSGHRRSEEHTSELQSRENLVCRLLLEKKKTTNL